MNPDMVVRRQHQIRLLPPGLRITWCNCDFRHRGFRNITYDNLPDMHGNNLRHLCRMWARMLSEMMIFTRP